MLSTNSMLLLKRTSTSFVLLISFFFLCSIQVKGQFVSPFSDIANENTSLTTSPFVSENHDFEGKTGVAYTMPFVTGGGCVAGTINRFTGSYHSNLYIGNNNGSNVLLGWGQNMATYASITASSGSDVYAPTVIPTANYSGIPYEVRSSSSGGGSGLSAMLLRTSTNLYFFGTAANLSAISTMASFGGASINTASSDITTKLPAGIAITDIAQMAVSQKAMALITNAGHVYMMTTNSKLQGDSATANGAIWHHVTLKSGSFLSGVTKFSLTSTGAFALTSTGKIYYWGTPANVNGLANTTTSYLYPYDMSAQIPSGQNVTDLVVVGSGTSAASSTLFLLCTNQKVYVSGMNTMGVLGQNNATTTFNQPSFITVKTTDGTTDLTNVTRIDGDTEADICTVAAMTSNGSIYGWGDNSATILGATGNAAVGSKAQPLTVKMFGATASGFTDFSVAGHFTIAFYNSGVSDQYWYVGHSTGGSQGAGVATSGTGFTESTSPVKIDASPLGISFNCSNTQPTITTTGSFTSFTSCANIASSTQSITISGSYLSDNITITAPSGFEVSTSAGSGFGTTATLSQSGGTVVSTTVYVRITSSATGSISGTLSCTSTGATTSTFSLTGTVNTLPIITSVSGASRTGAGTLTISGNTATSGATIDWYQNSTGGTALASGVNSTTSYTTPSLSTTTNYFAQARNLTTGCISATRSMTTATINGSYTAGVIGTDQTICYGKSPIALTSISDANGGSGVISYQWQQSTTSSSSGFTNISGQTLSTYTPGTLTTSTWFRRAAISTVDGTIYSSPVAITVNALPIASTPIDNSRTGAGPVIIGASATSGATIDWYATSTGGSVLTGGNGVTTFTTPSISVTTTYFAEARTTTAPGCLSSSRIAVLATINGSFSPGSIGADQSICSGVVPATLTSITDASGGTGPISYTWLKSTTSASSGFYTATGTYTSTTYSPGALTQTTYFKRTAKTTTGSDGTIETNVITITVNPLPFTPTGVNGSRYGTGTVNINATVNAGETVDWYDVSTGGSILSGGTGTLSFVTPSISATTNYYAQARNSTTGCISAARATVTASINIPASLTVTGTLTPFTTCSGVTSSIQTITVAGSSLTSDITIAALTGYEFSLDGTNFAISKVLTRSGSTVASTTVYIRLTSSALNGAGGNVTVSTTGASDINIATGSATVNTAPSITAQPSSSTQTLVQNANATALSVTATGSNLTYQWYSNSSNSNSGGTSILNATHSTYTPLTGTVGTLYYYVIVSGTCTPAVTSSVSGSIVVSASTSPTIGHVGDLTPFAECAGSASTAQTFTISGSSLTNDIVINALTGYEYSSDGTTYYNTLTLPQSSGTVVPTTVYVRLASGAVAGAGGDITITSTGATNHLIPTGSATINTAPAITAQPSSSAQILVRNASATALTVTATGSNLTYQWYSNSNNNNSTGNPITGATSSTYTPSTSSVGSLYYYVTVSGSCTPPVTSNVSGIVTVNGAASISSAASFTAFTTCSGTASAAQSFTVAGTNLTSDITIASLSGFEYSTDQVNYTSTITLTQSPSHTVSTTTIYVRLSNTATNGVGGDITISATGAVDNLVNTGAAIVNDLTAITTQPSNIGETLIQNSTSLLYSVNATGTNLTYQWYSNGANSNSGGTLIPGANSNTYRPSTLNLGTLYYYVVVNGTCSNLTSNVSGAINITTSPVITTNGTLTTFNACAGNVSSEQTFVVSGANLSDDILVAAPAGYEVSLTTATGFASNITLVNGGGTISNTTIYIRLTNAANNGDGGNVTISTSNASTQLVATGSANVNSNTISLTSATGTDAQTVNQNASITNITYSTTGATGATFTGLPTGVSGSWASNIVTISGVPSVIANSNYTVTLTGGCGAVTASGSIISLNPSLGSSTIVVTGLTSFTYNGSTQGPVTSTVTGSTATPTYSYSGTGSTSYGPSATLPTVPGTYQVIATVAGDANYNGATSTAYTFVINKAPSTITVTGTTSFTYNGLTQGPTTSNATGSNGLITYSYLGTSSTTYGPSTTLPKLPGTYQVIATLASNSNYNGATSAAYNFNITQLIEPPLVNNAKYILNQSGLPTNIAPLVKTTPAGTVPAWCDVATSICSTTPPATPTAVGKYIYQLKAYDTTTFAYSSNFVNDTLIIYPPAPVAFDSTFVIGVANNPANVGVQVNGLSGAVLNYYYANAKLGSVPVLGNVATVKKYNVSQTINNIESDTTSFTTTTLDPNTILHLQKIVDTGVLQANSTFNYQFTFVVTNFTKYPFSNLVLTDNLHNSVPITSEFSVLKKSATGGLLANQSFDGDNDIKLTTSSSYIGAYAKDTARFVMNLAPRGYNGTLKNTGYIKVDTKWGTIVMQSSANNSSDINTKNPTSYQVKDLKITIPEGFSPNHDGVHDKLVIIKPYNTTIDITVFNRWGNIVYSNSNYQNDWDGKGSGNFVGKDLVDGGYYYTIKAIDENGKSQILKGYVIIQR